MPAPVAPRLAVCSALTQFLPVSSEPLCPGGRVGASLSAAAAWRLRPASCTTRSGHITTSARVAPDARPPQPAWGPTHLSRWPRRPSQRGSSLPACLRPLPAVRPGASPSCARCRHFLQAACPARLRFRHCRLWLSPSSCLGGGGGVSPFVLPIRGPDADWHTAGRRKRARVDA